MPYVIRVTGQMPRAVATLEERICFNTDEWRKAGHDQPDGNLQFFHHVLILSRQYNGNSRRSDTAEVLWLHDGSISSGHIVDMLDRPGTPTKADRAKYPNWPERWPDRLIPESGGTIGPLPDGTLIEVEQINWFDVAKTTIDDLDRALYNAMAAPLSEKYPGVAERLLEAFNARESSQ